MTAYARPTDREQIVRLNPGEKTAAARPAPDRPHASMTEIGVGTCLEFAQSRRTGNIEITLVAETSPHGAVDAEVGPKILDSRPKPHAGMPAATGDFYEDLQSFGTKVPAAPQDAMMEDLMAGSGDEPASTRSASAGRGGVDVRLAQIVDAWPQLPARTRAAMIAMLRHTDQAEGPAGGASRLADRPPTLRPARARDTGAKDPAGGRRRGPRKPADPAS